MELPLIKSPQIWIHNGRMHTAFFPYKSDVYHIFSIRLSQVTNTTELQDDMSDSKKPWRIGLSWLNVLEVPQFSYETGTIPDDDTPIPYAVFFGEQILALVEVLRQQNTKQIVLWTER